MESRKNLWWLALALLILIGAVGCSGIIQELRHDDGATERVRFSTGESWRSWDRNATKEDSSSLILKKESTF